MFSPWLQILQCVYLPSVLEGYHNNTEHKEVWGGVVMTKTWCSVQLSGTNMQIWKTTDDNELKNISRIKSGVEPNNKSFMLSVNVSKQSYYRHKCKREIHSGWSRPRLEALYRNKASALMYFLRHDMELPLANIPAESVKKVATTSLVYGLQTAQPSSEQSPKKASDISVWELSSSFHFAAVAPNFSVSWWSLLRAAPGWVLRPD